MMITTSVPWLSRPLLVTVYIFHSLTMRDNGNLSAMLLWLFQVSWRAVAEGFWR